MLTLTLERTITVDRSVSDCFRYLADFSTCEQWDPGVRRAEKSTPGSSRGGSRFSLELDVLGRSAPAAYELREALPDRHLVLSGSGTGFSVVDRMDFTPLGSRRTRIQYRADMTLDSAPAASRPMMAVWGARLANKAMHGLTRALEQDGPDEPGRGPRVAERLFLPGLVQYTRRGYRSRASGRWATPDRLLAGVCRPMKPSPCGSARRFASSLLVLLALATLSAIPRAIADPTPVPLAASVDLPRFMGDWYVIAHIPPDADRQAHNGVESYRLVDGRVETTYRRRPGSFEAPEKIDAPVGYVKEGSGNALWGMRFWWWFPIRLEYRISYLEPDYSVTIIGRSKRDYVWLMSRTPEMSDGDYERYRALMASWGYDTSKLVRVPQRWPVQ